MNIFRHGRGAESQICNYDEVGAKPNLKALALYADC